MLHINDFVSNAIRFLRRNFVTKSYKRTLKFATNSFILHRKQKIKKDSNLFRSSQGS